MKNRVAVLHGINLGALDRRPAEHYGGLTYAKLEQQITRFGRELGLSIVCFQSNFEGAFVEELHKASDYADGLILNPGAWTHYAWSLRDAVRSPGYRWSRCISRTWITARRSGTCRCWRACATGRSPARAWTAIGKGSSC